MTANPNDDYQTVAERIKIFREKYPEGSLRPADLDHPFRLLVIDGQNYVAVTSAAYRHPEDKAPGIGQAWEIIPGTTEYTRGSELMVAETSSWGRAIIAVLAADSRKIATSDEVTLAKQRRIPRPPQPVAQVEQEPVEPPQPVAPVAPVAPPVLVAVPSEPAEQTITQPDLQNPFEVDEYQDIISSYISLLKDSSTTKQELREVWEVLSQAGLLARRVEPFGGLAPEGDGKVPIGTLVGHIGRQKG